MKMKISRAPMTWKVTRSTRLHALHSNQSINPCHFPPPNLAHFIFKHPPSQTIFIPFFLSSAMATLTLTTFTILFFFFFTFSSARISLPLTLPKSYVLDVSNSSPQSNSKQTILLPTEKPESTILPGQKPVSLNPATILPTQKLKLSDPTTILPAEKPEASNPTTILPSQKPESSDPTTILPGQKHDSSNPTTILPGQKLESSEPATILELELEPEITNPQTQTNNNQPGASDKDLPVLSDAISIETLHLNPSSYIRNRPINRHFRIKPSLFRIHRCCHHHMNHGDKGHEVPYGDDMILAGQTIDRFEPSMLRESVGSTPAKWGRIRHYQRDEDDSMMKRHPFRQYMFAKQKLKSKVEEENEKRKDQEERKEGGFMKKVRKFLNHI